MLFGILHPRKKAGVLLQQRSAGCLFFGVPQVDIQVCFSRGSRSSVSNSSPPFPPFILGCHIGRDRNVELPSSSLHPSFCEKRGDAVFPMRSPGRWEKDPLVLVGGFPARLVVEPKRNETPWLLFCGGNLPGTLDQSARCIVSCREAVAVRGFCTCQESVAA